jgi:capsular exopolysaccharide synthesis family protein
MASAALILLREMRRTGLRSAEELEAMTGLTVMGQLPVVNVRSRRAMLGYLADKPTSRLAEAFRDLRTSVMLSNLDAPPQAILSTSTLPGEGKTTQAIALAQNFAGLDRRVLLVECDIRRRTFSSRLGFSADRGLIEVLSGGLSLAEAVQGDPHLGSVDVLVGGASKINPVDVFSSDRFREFLREARSAYDVVILDAPPVLAVPDARVIAQEVDAVLYAVKWDDTPRSAIREGLRLLATVNVRPAGLVLTQVDLKGMERYGYGAYSKYGKGYYAN